MKKLNLIGIISASALLTFLTGFCLFGGAEDPIGPQGEQGIQGETGNGILSIDFTTTEGLVDVYTITFSNGNKKVFMVTNGKDGQQGIQGIQGEPGEDGHTPIITIQDGYWYIDGVNTEIAAIGIKGETGNGISAIELTSKDGLVDTYTITYTDGNTTTFTVTNGKEGPQGEQGIQGIQGEPGKDGHSPVITIQDGYWYIDGVSTGVVANGLVGDIGNGISSIKLTSKEGLVDTYTITYTDGNTTTFTVTNGKEGPQGEQGIQGIQGEPGKDGHSPVITIQDGYWYIDGVSTGVVANGLVGDIGNGISSIKLTSKEGLVDTYTITYTDGNTTTFTVTNGKEGPQGEQGIQGIQGEPGEDGHSPVITIQDGYWYIDGVSTGVVANGLAGDIGNGISSIKLTSSEGLVDTYTITYTDGNTTTFTVTNGKEGPQGEQGIQGIQGEPGKDGHSPVITIQDGYWYIDGVSTGVVAKGLAGDIGNGISSIKLTSSEGLVDTYTITYTDGNTTTFTVTNGKEGPQGEQGIQGIQGEPGKDGHSPVITIQDGYWYIDGVSTGVVANGLAGDIGNGISSIKLTSSEGLVDTYTITYTDGNTTTFTVTNGKEGPQGEQGIQGIQGEPGKDGHSPVITIQDGYWYIDGVSTGVTAIGIQGIQGPQGPQGETGQDGRSVVSITLTETKENVDTYTVLYSDKTTTTFTVTNGKDGHTGAQGIQGIQGEPGKDGHTPVITIEDGNWCIDGVDTGVKAQGIQGIQGLSAYEIYLKYHPDYTGSEKQWINDFVTGRLEADIWYDITFDSNGGSEVESQVVMEGRKITKPEEPTREGYTFKGWYYKGELWSFIGYDVTEDIELEAMWEENHTEGLLFITIEDGTYAVSVNFIKSYTEVVIPNYYNGIKVTTIFEDGFKDCVNLKSIKLPETLTHIQNNAFYGCVALEQIKLPDSLMYLGENAFYGCTKLHTVTIGSGLDTVSSYAFYNCNGLKTLNIPENVKTISPYAFYGCTKIETLVLEGESSWSCKTDTYYKATMISSSPYVYSYSTTTLYSPYDTEKTFTNKVVDSISFIETFVNGHSNIVYDYGQVSGAFAWYYMQTWTRN